MKINSIILLLIITTIITLNIMYIGITNTIKEQNVVHQTIVYNQLSLNLENVVNYMSVIGIDKKFHLEILSHMIYETGHFTSNARFKNNNLFGIMKGKDIRHYDHWTESICHWKLLFYDKFKSSSYYEWLTSYTRYSEIDTKLYVEKLKTIKVRL